MGNGPSHLLAAALSLAVCCEVSRAVAAEPESTAPVNADPRDTARTLANRAADAIAQGEHEQAEELLRQAYVQYPAPTIAVLHARTLVYLQRLSTAASVYERASLTSIGPDAPPAFRHAVEQAQKEAKELRPRVPRLQIVVRGQAARNPGLELTLDGRPLSAAQHGRWIWVDPGRRVVRAELNGAVSEQVVRVEERQAIVVDVSEPASERAFYRALTWSSLGLGAAGIATGVISGVVATSAYDQAAKSCPDERCVEGGAGAGELQRFHRYRVVSTVGYAVGAAGLALGGYLLIRSAVDGPALQLELEQQSARLSFRGTL